MTKGRIRRIIVAAFIGLLFATPNMAAAFEVQRVTSVGGLEAWLIEDHTNPIITMRFSFRGGASLDPAGKDGLAEMTSGLLDEGAGPLDSMAFQQKVEDSAITLRFDARRDFFGGRLRTLTENKVMALDLLQLAVTAPRFDAEPVERIRSQILANIRGESEDPDTIAYRKLFETLFPGHPYGRRVSGTEESVATITAEDLRRFVGRRLVREGLVVGIVGDISAPEVAAALDRVFGDLPETGSDWRVDETMPQGPGGLTVIEAQVPQSSIVFGQPGLKRDDPDYYAAYVLNHILGGGGFTARLYHEVREKRGLAYSVYSSLAPMEHAGLILGGAGTRNDRAAETVEIIRREWARMAAEGPTPEELADAKQFLTGSFPLRFSSSDRIAGTLVAIQTSDLGIDYLDRRNGFIEAVTLEDVRRVAGNLLDADSLVFTVVGQPEGLKPGG